ncbi:MAG: hypothetical protein COS99_06100 [Candidatus Omnitrophica bacterium CG07_land_8_20_14_0_80_42_15]|uniref:HEAT repeat domain-containing protein n=1 Tax=Candidatus Aquitaenariimonas noxiae TaxID=1974741 RepID=A0A2J0KZU7_9BACT|nr:MAG: hypothetical protein COS99_06100 [Candidatus Omnitrophica bacterium CG07_land_8_20_14_0_80_42_15]
MLKQVVTAILLLSFVLILSFVYVDLMEKKHLRNDIDFIISTLNNQEEALNIREKAASALKKIGGPAVKPLAFLLRNGDPYARRNAAFALGEVGNKDAAAYLVAASRDDNSRVRYNAIVALRKTGYKHPVGPLIEALKDESASVRMETAYFLGEIGNNNAVEALINLLKDENWGVREEVYVALKKITQEDFGRSYDNWSKWLEMKKNDKKEGK